MKEDIIMTREEYVSKYMEAFLKSNTLPYGLEYLSLRD